MFFFEKSAVGFSITPFDVMIFFLQFSKISSLSLCFPSAYILKCVHRLFLFIQRDRLPTPVFLGFPCGSAGKESTCNAGDLGSIPGLGKSPEEGKGYPLQYSGLENFMDCIIHGVAKSQTRLSDFHSLHDMVFIKFI